MIDERTAELLVERLIRRIEQANTYFLMKIGSSVKQIRDVKPSEAHKLVQILKYDGNYEQIVKEMAKYTNLNVKELDEIFSTYAKKDRLFYEKFYKYRNIPFDESPALKMQRKALTRIVQNEMYNYSRTNVVGYTISDIKPNGKKGKAVFYGLRETYNRVLDEAMLNVGQGKETFDNAMTRIMQELGGSGLKTIRYASGRTMRLDSATRMHLSDRLKELHNEQQQIIAEEIGADGVEISAHINPAPDHELAQGRQFSTVKPSKKKPSEWEKLQAGEEAKDYKGVSITLDHDGKNGYRPISAMNCKHKIFAIVLGVSQPEYTEEELQKIREDNDKGFEYNGKHYTMYEGTQLQRNLERAIREQKDTQILGRSSDNEELIYKSQDKIRTLTRKYKELSEISGLPTQAERLRVARYKRVAKKK